MSKEDMSKEEITKRIDQLEDIERERHFQDRWSLQDYTESADNKREIRELKERLASMEA